MISFGRQLPDPPLHGTSRELANYIDSHTAAVASESVIWCEKVALDVLTAPGSVLWNSPKKTPAVFGVLVDH